MRPLLSLPFPPLISCRSGHSVAGSQSVSQSQPVLQMTTTTTNQNIILCFIRLLLILQLLHSAPFIVVGLTFNIDCKLEPINRGQSNCTGQLSSTSYLIVLCRRHHLLRTDVPHSLSVTLTTNWNRCMDIWQSLWYPFHHILYSVVSNRSMSYLVKHNSHSDGNLFNQN